MNQFVSKKLLIIFTNFLWCLSFNINASTRKNVIEIITLTQDKWKLYKDLRLQAVKEIPQAFGTTYTEELSVSAADWKKRLTLNMLFAKKNELLVGMIGAVVEPKERLRHIGLIISFYIIPQERKKGIGNLLLKSIIDKLQSKNNIKKLILKVTTNQKDAINLYKKFGFHIVAILENEYFVDGKFYDQYLMTLFI